MPYIRVIYKTKEFGFDYVSGHRLESLITQDEITHFYRPSEKRWISIKFDPVRGRGGRYQGPERRRIVNSPISRPQKDDKGLYNAEGHCTNWLEGLWRDIESL
jgi:hypothetical protein